MSQKSFPFLSFLVGAAVGAVVALLYAPASGQELRSQIREEADVRWKMATDEFDKAVNSMQQALDDTRKEMLAQVETILASEKEQEETLEELVEEEGAA
ncbi:MAG: YtxH domain-containing protein [Anaerolineales bacterium]|jgi:gas vesicle protein|nr:YtxH domain-containing protein [Anaerolineales bacterium]